MSIPTIITGTGAFRDYQKFRLRCYASLVDMKADTNPLIISEGESGASSTSGVLSLNGLGFGPIGTSRSGSVRIAGGVGISETQRPFITIDGLKPDATWERFWAGKVQRAKRDWIEPDNWRAVTTTLELIGLHSLYENDLIPGNGVLSWNDPTASLPDGGAHMSVQALGVQPGETYGAHWARQLPTGGEYGTGAQLTNVAGVPQFCTPLVMNEPHGYLGLVESGREWNNSYSTRWYFSSGEGWHALTGNRNNVPDYVPRKAVSATIDPAFIESVISPWNGTTFSDPFNSMFTLTGWNVSRVHGWNGSTPTKSNDRTAETVSAIWRGNLIISNYTRWISTDGAGNVTRYFPTLAVRGFRETGTGFQVFASGSPFSSPPSLFNVDSNGTFPISVRMPDEWVTDGGNWRVIVEIITPGLPGGTPSVGSFDYRLELGSAEGQPEYRRKDQNVNPTDVPGINDSFLVGPTFTFYRPGVWIPPIQVQALPDALGTGPIQQYDGTASVDWLAGKEPITTLETAFMPRRESPSRRR